MDEKAGAEELLVLLATAIKNRNGVRAKQAVQALQKISSLDGELPSERVTAFFLRALVLRAGSLLHDRNLVLPTEDPDEDDELQLQDPPHQMQWAERSLGFNELTNLVDMTPFYRFGFVAANGAILEAFEGMDRVHILDFSTSHCMQWPTLIDALADRMDGPPHVRLTVSTCALPTAPRLHPTYEDIGHRLTLWAREKGVPFEFHLLSRPLESLRVTDMNLRDGESLAINCNLRLHYLGDETLHRENMNLDIPNTPQSTLCPRDNFLQLVSVLNPAVVTIYEQDCNATSTDLVSRLTESYSHEWIPFDYLATYGRRGRHEHERDVGERIENVLACEGVERIERLESKGMWLQRLRRMHFRNVPVSEDVTAALREMVGDYAVGWGVKLDEDDVQILSWKGHSFAFASAWVPVAPGGSNPLKLGYLHLQ